MQDLNDLYYFVKTVEHGGFAPAGRALGIPKSKLSRRIAGLEERLGVQLIYRSTRQFNVTEIGQTFLTHCKAMLVEADAAREAIEFSHAEPCGTIKVTCPIALLHVHIGQVLADFMDLYPKVNIQLEASNRRVDLIAEGVDVAIRVRPAPLEDSELILKVLSERGLCLLASPGLVEKQGMPSSPGDLSGWPSLGLGEPQHQYNWTLYGPDGEEAVVPHIPRYVTTDMIALRKAALKGVGIVQLPSLMVTEQLKDGSLIHLLPEWQPKRDIIHVVYPSRRGLLPAVRALIDYLSNYYQSFEED
ncbi:LysR family transcriptional regulator [Vibrio parahaemolyticus]|uniref:LysR family transcriptional regulator n=1 Tax=Vibrio alginolyticus TaxID=663 RepID=UPI0023EDF3ED|nr:LysR family transcriptional regulator [Vibrio alginolyticus]MDF4345083.1 LysR family transcriptional regulator [Vibrio parahaemolyticus]MDF4357361.1 LysR family transcriptional regulator [Vibrio parahaemolyticus]MDF4418884.1 LysR family transcriptional regulator [Vibrio parahaemolyticus]MDF4526782.1 LysR family transcriptional regulator [Vibrio parahaemolyticus]MDF4554029.1 LysR family transcriptional regulator [Vibrio parahaemolyticus]